MDAYGPGDREDYLRLLGGAWGAQALSPAEFDWWFDGNPAGSLRSVARAERGVVGVAGPAGLYGEAAPQMADRRLATLAVLAEQLAAPLGRPAPTKVVALELGWPHALPATGLDNEIRRMDLQEDFERRSREARIDGVVDQLGDRIGGGPVVGEERGGNRWVDPLADGDTLSHSTGNLYRSAWDRRISSAVL